MCGNILHVFGLGQCSLDYIGIIDDYPQPDGKCEFYDMIIQGGGPVATALVALARWGLLCAFAGVVGDDPFGEVIKKSLDEEGVNTSGIVVRKGFFSQFAFIVAERGSGRRTVFWRRPTGLPLMEGEINYDMLERSMVFHTDGLFMEASLSAARRAKKKGVKIVVDAGSLREGMLDLARLSDFFIASEAFSRAFSEAGDPVFTCYRIAELGPYLAGVTLGSRGYVAVYDNRLIIRPAYPVSAVDTTGCGDVFHAGFIYGLIKGWDVERSLDFGAWSASMVSLELGGRKGIPSLEEIKKKGYF